MSTFSVLVDLPTDCISTFLSPAETDVLAPVLSQWTDGVSVSFAVVLKFPNITIRAANAVESVQLNSVVQGFVVVLKFTNITRRTTKTVESIQLKGGIRPSFFIDHCLCVITYPSTLSCHWTPGNLLDIYKSWCLVTFGIHLDTYNSNFLDYWYTNGCSCF